MCFSPGSAFTMLSTSRPLSLGRFKSRRTRSGSLAPVCRPCLRRKSIASIPSLATETSHGKSRIASMTRSTSPGLSSTRRTCIRRTVLVVSPMALLVAAFAREGEQEARARARPGLDPDPAAMALDDLLADGEADAGARVLGARVQPPEDDEDPFPVLRVDADPVVAHREEPLLLARQAGDVDRGSLVGPAELDGVSDEILEHLREAGGVHAEGWERAAGDHRVALLDRGAQVLQRLIEHRARVDERRWFVDPPDAGELEQAADERLHALRALDRVVDVLLRLRVHLPGVALLEELHVARDHPERFLQVVRCNVRELLELRVRPPERLRLVAQRLLGGGALGHLAAKLRVHLLHLALLVLEVVEDVDDRALRLLQPPLLIPEVVEDVLQGAQRHALARPLLAAVVEDVQDRALHLLQPALLVPEVVEDVQDGLLRVVLASAFGAEVLEDVEDGTVRVRQVVLELRPIGRRHGHQRELLSGGTILRSSSISFFS